MTFQNTIVAENTAATGANFDLVGGTVTSLGGNLTNDASAPAFFIASDQFNVNPLLGPLADNGGTVVLPNGSHTFTYSLLVESPAIDHGVPNGLATDERGYFRPGGGISLDVGSFETQDTVAAEFPGYGVYEYFQGVGFESLHSGDTSLLAIAGNGDIVGEFPGYGVYRYTPSDGLWHLLASVNATALGIAANGNVFGVFSNGINGYSTGPRWFLLPGYTANVTVMVVDGNGDVFATIPGYGVDEYKGGQWFAPNTPDATVLAVNAGGTLVGEFAGLTGVMEIKPGGGLQPLTSFNATLLAIDPAGDVAGQFTGQGLGEIKAGGAFMLLDARTADALTIDDQGDIFVDFPGDGVYEFLATGGMGQLLTPSHASVLAAI